MALNYRRQGLISSENGPKTNLPGKTAKDGTTGVVGKRQALGEIKNQIHVLNTANKGNLKKQSSIPGHKPALKSSKTTSTLINVQESRKTTVAEKTSENLINKSQIINKIETACVIKTNKVKSYSTQRIEPFDDDDIDIDIDNDNDDVNDDPQFVSEYIKDIFAYLRALELKYPIDELFLVSHRTTTRMRSVLVNWLVEVHANFKMLPETLHLCIQILDRYLGKNKSIGRENLQLVGITALWIAGKYEEMFIPEIGDFVFIGDDSFTAEEMKATELAMMKALDCSFGKPLSIHFLRRYSKIANARPQYHSLAKYLLELALFECDTCFIRPSVQAAAAYYLATSVFIGTTSPSQIWSRPLVHYSTYTFKDIEKTVKLLADAAVKAETSKYQAIRTKYSHSDFGKISLCPELKGSVIRKFCSK